MPPVANERAQMSRERREAVMHVVGASPRDRRKGTKIARHRVGPDRLALDDASVAVAGLQAHFVSIDQRDRPAAALQVERRSDAHHPAPRTIALLVAMMPLTRAFAPRP